MKRALNKIVDEINVCPHCGGRSFKMTATFPILSNVWYGFTHEMTVDMKFNCELCGFETRFRSKTEI